MTQDEIIELAREASSHGVENHRSGEVSFVFYNEHLMNFAQLVAAAEREACAKMCDETITKAYDSWDRGVNTACVELARAIRAKGQQ